MILREGVERKERSGKMEQKKLEKLINLLIVFRVVLRAMQCMGVTGDQAVINVSVNIYHLR